MTDFCKGQVFLLEAIFCIGQVRIQWLKPILCGVENVALPLNVIKLFQAVLFLVQK